MSSGLLIEVLIVDDHKIVREGLKHILDESDNILVKDEASNGDEAFQMIVENNYDLILLDISMPGKSGLEVLREIKSYKPTQKVLILSMHAENIYAKRTLKAGASGYMTKESASVDLVKAIQKIHAGGKFISPMLAEILIEGLSGEIVITPHDNLSNREFQVFEKIATGKKVFEIAEELHLSSKTISTYRTRILEKMNMKTNSELTQYAIQNKLV